MLRLTCVYVISSFSLRELSLHSHLLSPSLSLSLCGIIMRVAPAPSLPSKKTTHNFTSFQLSDSALTHLWFPLTTFLVVAVTLPSPAGSKPHLTLYREHTTITTFPALSYVICETVFTGVIHHYLCADVYPGISCLLLLVCHFTSSSCVFCFSFSTFYLSFFVLLLSSQQTFISLNPVKVNVKSFLQFHAC